MFYRGDAQAPGGGDASLDGGFRLDHLIHLLLVRQFAGRVALRAWAHRPVWRIAECGGADLLCLWIAPGAGGGGNTGGGTRSAAHALLGAGLHERGAGHSDAHWGRSRLAGAVLISLANSAKPAPARCSLSRLRLSVLSASALDKKTGAAFKRHRR
jgi:hypothetical protein